MNPHPLLDPDLMPLCDEAFNWQFTLDTLPQVRERVLEMGAEAPSPLPAFPMVAVSEQYIPGLPDTPDVRAVLFVPQHQPPPWPVLLWIHGGGYVFGRAEAADAQLLALVDQIGCAVLSVDYRLAPETPFPGPLEDCYAALQWLHSQAAALGVDATRIAIGGDSAGGGLAAGLALLARDRGEVPVALQLLIEPMLDDRTVTTAEPLPHIGQYVWTAADNHFGWSCYLGQAPGGDGVSPYAAPARAESLAGLPATFIAVGALDLFLEEDLEYARRLLRAGVPTELHVYPGAIHGFTLLADAQVTRVFLRAVLDALRRAFAPRPAA